MKAVISINMDNDVFCDSAGDYDNLLAAHEVTRILEKIAQDQAENTLHFTPGFSVLLEDVNGNGVGVFRVER